MHGLCLCPMRVRSGNYRWNLKFIAASRYRQRLTSPGRAYPFERLDEWEDDFQPRFYIVFTNRWQLPSLFSLSCLQASDSPWAQIGRRLRPQTPALFFCFTRLFALEGSSLRNQPAADRDAAGRCYVHRTRRIPGGQEDRIGPMIIRSSGERHPASGWRNIPPEKTSWRVVLG
jgi:hypothetical protein